MGYLWTAIIGFLGGTVSGLFGVGGGVVFVPLLILLLGFATHMAIGTSLAAIVPTAAVALVNYARSGKVDWRTALFIAVFAAAGAWIGSTLALRINALLLKRLYAVVLVLIALKIFFQKS